MPTRSTTTRFQERVITVVKSIPRGGVLSYGEVALRSGNPGAARAVGTIMAQNKDKSVPCHRVIRADGSVGEYNGLRGEKGRLLKKEGHLVINAKIQKLRTREQPRTKESRRGSLVSPVGD